MANLFNTHETNVMYILYTYIPFKDMIRIRHLQVLNQYINVYNFVHAKLSAFFLIFLKELSTHLYNTET